MYSRLDGVDYRYDAYLPAPDGPPPPVVVFVHGDGPPDFLREPRLWGQYISWAALTASRGMAAITFDHASSEGRTRMPSVVAQIEPEDSGTRLDPRTRADAGCWRAKACEVSMDWLPTALGWGLAVALFAIVVCRVRREPWRNIALNALGYPLFLIGIGWAGEVGSQAFWAAVAASLGSLLFTMAAYHRRPVRSGEHQSAER